MPIKATPIKSISGNSIAHKLTYMTVWMIYNALRDWGLYIKSLIPTQSLADFIQELIVLV